MMKKVELKKEEKAKGRKEEKIMSGEKSEGEEKMDKCSTSQKNRPLGKMHKKEKNNGHVSDGE
jgi:hypothetical protein